ncbi:MAG TPA: class I SAM-dependent methyltransferase [Microbacteriaceae bacterium]|nr:class I SAM-dependent methyltransferase [Microbacteriaceae bacterium]
MNDSSLPTLERYCDVVVIGGGPAGLAAALETGRRRRSVIVIDAEDPALTDGTGTADDDALAAAREKVRGWGGEIITGWVERVTHTDDDLFRAELAGGGRVVARRVVIAPEGPADVLPEVESAHPEAKGTGPAPRLPEQGMPAPEKAASSTKIPGVYAIAPATRAEGWAALAAEGAQAGIAAASSLADEDARAGSAPRPSGNEADWDHRYSGDPLWSGNPNGALVAEAGEIAPGSALDVGAGEGGDALWLAEHGWRVTASDISRRALERVEAEAQRRGLCVACHHADANAPGAFPHEAFDLVCASYASIPRTPDDRAVHGIVGSVAPGGTLLVIGHDLRPAEEHADTATPCVAGHPDLTAGLEHAGHGTSFDPEAYVRVDDFAAALAGRADWVVEVHEARPRPAGAASASHHTSDLVFRARRRA